MTSADDATAGNWDVAPRVLVFSDTAQGLADVSQCAQRNGGRLAAALPLGEAPARLERQVLLDLLILDISEDHGQLLEDLFRKVNEGAETSLFRSIVIISSDILDLAAPLLIHEEVTVLVGRDGDSLSAAIGSVLHRTLPQLNDISEDDSELRLRELADGMQANARRITHLARINGALGADEPYGVDGLADRDDVKNENAQAIRDIIRARRLRDQFFSDGIFADPAWDILLDLTAARIEERSVAVSSLCIAAAVPATTALRWIKHLTASGWLRRVADPDDGRRIFIELTDRAADSMFAYFVALSRLNKS